MCGVLLGLFNASGAVLASTSDEEAIRGALTRWMADFNEGRADRICDLFATDLRYDFREFPERDYQQICAVLHRSLADPARRYSYAVDIKEILVAGDLGVVRLVWSLSVAPRGQGAQTTTTQEYSMDLFRRQPDGSWKIIRFLAYEAP